MSPLRRLTDQNAKEMSGLPPEKNKSMDVRGDSMINSFKFSIFLLVDLCSSLGRGCKGTVHKKMFVSVFSSDQVTSLVFMSVEGV